MSTPVTNAVFRIPDELRFAITRKCDGKCRHCYNQSGINTDRLTADDIIRIIRDIHSRNPGFDRITLTGGEPLQEKEKLLHICRAVKPLNIRIRLVTRGWELNPEICQDLKESGVTRIQIGLDSSGKLQYVDKNKVVWDSFHSWLRNDRLGFRKTIKAIHYAVEAGLDVSVRFSLCRSNLDDMVKTYNYISGLGASKFKFRLLFPDGRAKNRLKAELINGHELAKAQYELIRASKEFKMQTEITQPCFFKLPNREELSKYSYTYNAHKETCPCGTAAAYIDSNGDVKYCLFDEKILGNVQEQSFLNIWNSASTNLIREKRCPLDRSGTSCSSFKILYEEHTDYSTFIQAYYKTVQAKEKLLISQ